MKRRTLIQALGAAFHLATLRQALAQPAPEASACRLISQDIIGPFAIENPPMRSNLRGDLPGMPLRLNFLIKDALSCQPLPGALVSIWHSNHEGLYSHVVNTLLDDLNQPTGETRDYTKADWLRGVQKSDEMGRVIFDTIVPGWYFPRPTHIHVQVFPPTYGEVASTQLYLRDEDCDQIYSEGAYAGRGPNPIRTDPNADAPMDGTDEGDLWLTLTPSDHGLVASHEIGVVYYGKQFGELPDIYRQG